MGLASRPPPPEYEGGFTLYLAFTSFIAAVAGLLFGYDMGISGGLSTMRSFLQEFFPNIYEKTKHRPLFRADAYCQYNNHMLTLFTSSLYLAALVSSFFASTISRKHGRRVSIFLSGLFFLFGAALGGYATNVTMLIFGRLSLGFGVGFGNQAVPVYLSEMAPAKLRGSLNLSFHVATAIGIFIANIVNFIAPFVDKTEGWRFSIGLVAVPAVFLTLGALILPDTPSSLIERGHPDAAKKVLQRIRGMVNVEREYNDLINACYFSNKIEYPWKHMFTRRYRPQLIMCTLIPLFSQFTGIIVVLFYLPILFKTLGFGDQAAIVSASLIAIVLLLTTFVSVALVDKCGRKALFIEGGIQMLICQLAAQIGVGFIIAKKFGVKGEGFLTRDDASMLLLLISLYFAAFSWSWGPLGFLVPTEICPLELRSAGQAISVSIGMLFTFILAQVFVSMLCYMKFGLFFFFATFLVAMTLFIYLFVPETKNVPLEEMSWVLKVHWFWGDYIPDEVIFEDPEGSYANWLDNRVK
ncbi:hypothetical protein CDL15_Pgr026129 [Punica granatum]|uniref:Major facilitator superfamily (MFS) profile domain-containing protein n=1 Tax=Punica granatum TaxID=22663 RepID=A0A218WCQ1_PUNGR|nr:hypothetical protein CDL15_Pgr026129 [Punica granatum]